MEGGLLKGERKMPRSFGYGPLRLRLRGSGRTIMGLARSGGKRPLGRGLLGLGIPVVTALIHDMRRPDGYLRPYIDKILHRKPAIKVIDAQAKAIEEKKQEVEKK